jgi:uncharacterized protein (TIGR02145 family)
MKTRKLVLIPLLISGLIFISTVSFAQVSINTDSSMAHPSAGLDVKFTDKGVLFPRMTMAERDAIVNPANGLIVICTDCGEGGTLSIFLNGIWRIAPVADCNIAPPTAGTHNASSTQIIWNWNAVTGATGYKWNTSDDYGTATDMGTATSKTETGLTCNTLYTRYIWAYTMCGNSTSKTLTQTTVQNLPSPPAAGIHVPSETQIIWNWNAVTGATGYRWNTTNDYGTATDMGAATSKTESGLTCNLSYTRYVWSYNNCGASESVMLTEATTPIPYAPVAGSHVPSATQIIWNWNTVSGATGYKWNTTNDYSTASEMGTITTKTETGLTCNTPYLRYVWAYNNCGHSDSTTLTQNTTNTPPVAPTAGIHYASSTQIIWNWNTVTGANGYKWNINNDYNSATNLGTLTSKTDTGLNCNTAYSRYVWAYNSCGNSSVTVLTKTTASNPSAPITGAPVPSPTQIIWSWNPVEGSIGYKWNTINDYGTTIDLGTLTSKTDTGLTCNTYYSRYVWAYNNCGHSVSTTMTQVTLLNLPPSPTAGTHVSSPTQIIWNWFKVNEATGYKWNTTNDYATATEMDSTTTKTETGLAPYTSYSRYVWSYNSCGHSGSTMLTQITFAWNGMAGACPESPTVTYDGQIYNTIKIGDQCWLRENLNTGTMIPGSQDQMNNNTIEKYCFNNLSTNCDVYGGLYEWGEMVSYLNGASDTSSWNPPPAGNVQGICPSGWHIPTLEEWNTLYVAFGTSYGAGDKLKENGTAHWITGGASNSSGFTALPGGYSHTLYGFQELGYRAYFWLHAETGPVAARAKSMWHNVNEVYEVFTGKSVGYSVRCLKDCTIPSSPSQGIHLPSQTLIIWKWNAVSGANGYKWNTTDNFGNATDMGTSTSKIETGLTCDSAYLRYIWAYNSCGFVAKTVLSQTTKPCTGTAVVCPGVPTVTYGEQTYNTVQIGNQCWIKENLNFGTRINASVSQTNNGTIEKYCYNNLPSNCDVYGGLYQWAELLNYTSPGNSNPSGIKGICPTGWHVPSDDEWCQMELFLDPTVDCNIEGLRGTDAGGFLKETGITHWNSPNTGATNISGFTALPGGGGHGYYYSLNYSGGFYTSTSLTSYTLPIYRGLSSTNSAIERNHRNLYDAISARCVKDDCDLLAIPVQGTHLPSSSQITWNWIAVTGATGYKWGFTDDYYKAIDLGTANSYTETGIACNTPFTRYVWAYNACGNSNSVTITQTTSLCTGDCGQPMTDIRDGKTYNTVLIGTQCWFAQNLNIGNRIDVSEIQTNNGIIEKYCQGNTDGYCSIYGGLYVWDEMMNYTNSSSSNPSGREGICPAGWHLPSDDEWCQMEVFLDSTVICSGINSDRSTDAGGKMKEGGTLRWFPPNTGATNESGFSALPAGNWHISATFSGLTSKAVFWSCTENSSADAWVRFAEYNNARISRSDNLKISFAFSVRCIKD